MSEQANEQIEETDRVEAVDAKPEKEGTEQQPAEADGFTPITSQADLDRIIKDRLARERRKAGEQVEAVKAATATQLEALERQFAETRAAFDALQAEKQQDEARARISKDTGVPVDVIRGANEEEMKAHAEQLAALLKRGPVVPTGHLKPDTPGNSDALQTVRQLFRR